MTKREIQERSGFVIFWDGPFVDGAGRHIPSWWWPAAQFIRYSRDRDPGDEDRP